LKRERRVVWKGRGGKFEKREEGSLERERRGVWKEREGDMKGRRRRRQNCSGWGSEARVDPW